MKFCALDLCQQGRLKCDHPDCGPIGCFASSVDADIAQTNAAIAKRPKPAEPDLPITMEGGPGIVSRLLATAGRWLRKAGQQ